jgi:predicted TIM-barrel fold metal-dependent hydrolase
MIYDPAHRLRSVGRPINLDAVACDFPELKLIGIHVGIPWTEEMIAMAWKHPNVYIGCDAHSPKYWPASFVHYINTFGQDKVIFGTDFPILDFQKTLQQIDDLQLRPVSKQKLLRDNAIAIYKLNLEKLADHDA